MSHYDLLGIGGAHIDRIGRTHARHLPGTSNPGSMSESVGGGVFNALRVAALRQAGAIALVSVRGADSAGVLIEQAIKQAGFSDLSGVCQGSSSATYTAILDQSGELITALADMAIYDDPLSQHLEQPSVLAALADSGMHLVDANLSPSTLQGLAETARGPLSAIAISASKVVRLIPIARRLDVVFMNHHEAGLLSGQEDVHHAARHCVETIGFKSCVVTQGARPVLVAQAGEVWSVQVPPTDVVDVTGAGDALCGGTMAALMRVPDMPLCQAVREGIACSALTLGAAGPVGTSIASRAFAETLATVSVPTPLPARSA